MPLRLCDLPHSTHVAFAVDELTLAEALGRILGDKYIENRLRFGSYEIVSDAPCSTRVLYTLEKKKGAEFPRALNSDEAASEIHKLRAEARYPPYSDGFPALPGWEIRTSCHEGTPVAIIFAVKVMREYLETV